jgi:hypothetical protein
MSDRLESAARLGSDALRRRIRCDEFRVLRLELLELTYETVVLGVRDLDVVERVISIVVVSDLVAQ